MSASTRVSELLGYPSEARLLILNADDFDSHCHIHTRQEDIFDMTVNLANEYRLALRASTEPFITKLQMR